MHAMALNNVDTELQYITVMIYTVFFNILVKKAVGCLNMSV